MELVMILIIVLVLFIFILVYVSYNLFKKVELLEKTTDSQEQYIIGFSHTLQYTEDRLRDIDEKGSFQSDDEIGWFFESIKTLQKELNDFNINDRRK